jgi:hypothetical protein
VAGGEVIADVPENTVARHWHCDPAIRWDSPSFDSSRGGWSGSRSSSRSSEPAGRGNDRRPDHVRQLAIVKDGDDLTAIVTKTDLIDWLAAR